MFGIILSIVAVYLLFNVFTFKYSSPKAILVILAILGVAMLTGCLIVVAISGLFGIIIAALYMIKHALDGLRKIFKGVK